MLKKFMTRKNTKASKRKEFLSGLHFETLERRELLAGDLGAAYADVAEGEGGFLTGYYAPPSVSFAGNGYVDSSTTVGKAPLDVAIEYLQENAADFNLTSADFSEFVVKSEVFSQHTRVTHIAMQQMLNGLPVQNTYANVAVDNDGRILAASTNFLSGIGGEQQSEVVFEPEVDSVQAFQSLVSALGLTLTETPSVTSSSSGVSQQQTLSGGGVAEGNVDVQLVYVPSASGVDLAWSLEFLAPSVDAAYSGVVSADAAGNALYAVDRMRDAFYRVYELPDGHPGAVDSTIVTDAVVDARASQFGWHDTDGVVGPEFTDTRGNNVWVSEGIAGANGFNTLGTMAEGGPDLEFDYPYNDLLGPFAQENVEAATVQAFYIANVLHDSLYRYGFDEAAGNFQANNYTGNGLPGDQMIISVADPDSVGNILPLEDGIAPLMQLGFSPNGTSIAMDPDVVIHEYAHGVWERTLGGPLTPAQQTSADGDQVGAMNEGFADYLAVWYGMQDTYTPDFPRYMGPYSDVLLNGEGIRSVPYAHDLSVDPITFDSWNDDPGHMGNQNNQIHNGGTIWASFLYDMTWELIFKYGGVRNADAMQVAFNEDVYQSVGGLAGRHSTLTNTIGADDIDLTTGANNLALQLVLDGLKMSPLDPTFGQMRDSILAADVALTGGVNHDAIWRAASRRGLGYSSESDLLGAGSQTPQISPSYDMPFTTSDVGGTAFIDGDLDGEQSLAEPGLAGVTLYVDINGNGTRERLEPMTVTDENGDYNFVMYTGGIFNIKALTPDEMFQTAPETTSIPGGPLVDGSHEVFVPIGQSASDLDFGFTPGDSEYGIYGTKFEDLNGDGLWDETSEPGIAGVYIYLDEDGDGRIDIGERATVTGQDGSYFIDLTSPSYAPAVPSGTYQIREVLSPGWTQTAPGDDGAHEITITAGIAVHNINFGNQEQKDYGDLPESFDGTNPAAHGILDGLHLGTAVDADPGPNNGLQANGDDFTGVNDDDGVVFVDNLVRGMDDVTMEVTASIGDNSSALLNAWIDFDGDGAFDSASEQIVSNLRLTEGVNSIDIAIPLDAQIGATYARFRYGYESNIGPNGEAMAGEVEDYRLDASFSGGILDDQPYAIDDTFSVNQGDVAVSFDVLANDFGSSNGPATLVTPNPNPIPTGQGGSALVNLATGRIFYTPADGFVGTDTFNYEVTDGAGEFDSGTVTVHVLPQFTDPVAIDDYQILTDTTVGGENLISVLDNDIQGAFPPLNIVSWTNGNHGNVVLEGNDLKYVRSDATPYTLDTFTYTVAGSAAGQPTSTATVTVELAENVDTVEYIVEALSPLSGLPMTAGSQVVEGDQFTLRVSVKDSRTIAETDAGVYAAYVDLLYDADHLQVVPGTLANGSIFTDITQGSSVVPGLINEAGGVQDGVDQSSFDRGWDAMEVFTVDVIAIASTNGGVTLLETDPVDVTPLHDTVIIAPSPATIPVLNIDYNSTSIQILGGEGESLLDTNRDGAVTPIDALGIINQLNEFGTGAVAEGETFGLDQAMDVNRDSFISPLDALSIINYLNENSGDVGEGEAIEIVPQATIDTNVAGNEINAIDAVTAEVVDEYLRVRENEIGLAYFTGGSLEVVEEDASDLESAIDDLADDVFGQWN